MIEAAQLLLINGESIVFEDEQKLGLFLDFVFAANTPWVPPGRNNGRTAAHRERYCLRYFLSLGRDDFQYPIAVEKSERPDFIISQHNGATIGIEQTDAGPEALQRWLAQTEDSPDPQLPPEREGRGPSAGFAEPHMYDEAAADIVQALQNKNRSINKAGYQQADKYVLIIYLLVNAPLGSDGDFDEILARLPSPEQADPQTDGLSRRFDQVLVVFGGEARFWGVTS